MQVPDAIGVIEGWRVWQIPASISTHGKYPVKLQSMAAHSFWIPGEPCIAKCGVRSQLQLRHPEAFEFCENPPGEGHACGLYSAKTLEWLVGGFNYHTQYDAENTFVVVGKVANWGKVIEHEWGYRAEKSYPVLLYVPYEAWHFVKPLEEAYHVPVELRNVFTLDRES